MIAAGFKIVIARGNQLTSVGDFTESEQQRSRA